MASNLGKWGDQNFGPFLPPDLRWGNLIKIFWVFKHNLRGLGPPLQVSSMEGRPPTQGASNISEKQADKQFGPFRPPLARSGNLIQIFSHFNTQTNKPRASPASFLHVGRTPYSRGNKYGEKRLINIWYILASIPAVGELDQIFSHFNTQTNKPRASPASFLHVLKAPYSRGFKYGENNPIKNFVHIGLQGRCERT